MRPLKLIRQLIEDAVNRGHGDPDEILEEVVENAPAGIDWQKWLPVILALIQVFLASKKKAQ